MNEGTQRLPLIRIMVANATLLSAIYLGLGLCLESLRRFFPSNFSARAWEAFDQLPARALELTFLMPMIREAYLAGRISEFWLRIIFGLTSVGIIFGMALGVGLFMWIVRRIFYPQAG